MTTVYLVRHAEAMGNINETFQGRTDCEISEKGYRQLEYLRERFKDIPIEKVYSSPLIRTIETAKAVNYYHNHEINIIDDLVEINGGLFEGNLWKELPILYPEAYDLWSNKHHLFEIENGESMKQVYDRMKASIDKIVRSNINKTIAVISHGCAIRNYLCFANNMEFEVLDSIKWCDNTGISKLEYDNNFVPSIVFQNDASHLDTQNSTLQNQNWWKK